MLFTPLLSRRHPQQKHKQFIVVTFRDSEAAHSCFANNPSWLLIISLDLCTFETYMGPYFVTQFKE